MFVLKMKRLIIVAVIVVVVAILLTYIMFSFDPESVRGKRVLVTGASSGIGEQIAYEYAKLGAKLVITARRHELLIQVAKNCSELGAQSVSVVVADVTVPAEREKLAAETLKIFEGLDILILNHGVMPFGLWKFSQENFTMLENAMNVNFLSSVHITTLFIDSLKQSKGQIGVVSSTSGKHSFPFMTHYATTKQALQAFFSGIRQELDLVNAGVTVTLAVYGIIATPSAMKIINQYFDWIDISPFLGQTESAAWALVKGVGQGTDEVYYPFYARGIGLLGLAPGLIGTTSVFWIRLISNFIEIPNM